MFAVSKSYLLLVLSAVVAFGYSVLAKDVALPIDIRKFMTMFTTLDANKDGNLTVDDYHALYRNLAKVRKIGKDKEDRAHKEVIVKGWKTLPFDKDGKGNPVKIDEFTESLKKHKNNPVLKLRIPAFMTFLYSIAASGDDEDGLTREEWREIYKIRNLSAEDADECFDRMDTDHNGMVSREEFLAAGDDFFFGDSEDGPGALFAGPLVKA